jgi:hypothetical protein
MIFTGHRFKAFSNPMNGDSMTKPSICFGRTKCVSDGHHPQSKRMITPIPMLDKI